MAETSTTSPEELEAEDMRRRVYEDAQDAAKRAVAGRGPIGPIGPPAPVVGPPVPTSIRPTISDDMTEWQAAGARPPSPTHGPGNPTAPGYPAAPKQEPKEAQVTDDSLPDGVSGASGAGTDGGYRGSPMQVIPGGMRPYTSELDVHEGKPVAPEVRRAVGGAAGLEMAATGLGRDAAKGFYAKEREIQEAQLAANNDARIQQSRINFEREQAVAQRLAHVETLNKEAQGKPEDLWSDRNALAMVLGVFATAMAGASLAAGGKGGLVGFATGAALGKMLDSAVDRDMKAKLEDRKAAGQAADREMNLLQLHERNLGDRSQAVEATRLAYYDNLLQQLQVYKAEHKIAEADPRAMQLEAEILRKRGMTENAFNLQGMDDRKHKDIQKYAAPQVIGGGAATKEPGNIITIGGVSYQMPNEKTQNDAIAKIEVYGELIQLNNNIKTLRKKAEGLDPILDHFKWQEVTMRLEAMEQTKLKKVETAAKQGVLREGEYPRAQAMTGHATTGLGILKGNPFARAKKAAADRVLDDQTAEWSTNLENVPKAASAPIVKRGVQIRPGTNEPVPTARHTGKLTEPSTGTATPGFDPSGGRHTATQGESAEDTTPSAPVLPYRAPPAAAGRRKKEK